MPLKLVPAIVKDFLLEKSDEKFECKGTTVSIRQVSQGDQEKRNDLFAEFKRTIETDGSTTITQRISFDDIKRLEVFLTLADCNIEDEDGKPLFTFENKRLKDKASFEKAWGKLPPLTANEIHEKVKELNIMWSEGGDDPL